MRRTKEEALETRRAILKVALESFSKRGYTLTTFNDIAKRIHLTKGAIFWHFKSKEELLAALLVHMREIFDPLKPLEHASTLGEVRDAFMEWANVLKEHAFHRKFMTFILSQVEWSEALKTKLRKKLESILAPDPFALLISCLQRLKDSGEIVSPLSAAQLATLMSSCFFGTFRSAYLNKCSIDPQSTLAAGLDFIIEGIRRK